MDKNRLNQAKLDKVLAVLNNELSASTVLSTEEESLLQEFIAIKANVKVYDGEIPDTETSLTELKRKLNFADEENEPSIKPVKLWPRVVAAASILLVLGAGLWFYNKGILSPKASMSLSKGNDIAPGRNIAMLTLGDGRVVKLSDAKTGVIINANDLSYTDGSSIQDNTVNHLSGSRKGDQSISLVTPRGGQYQVKLSDGTLVWLNAASKLIFPSKFTGSERKVQLSGEGYFEVAKSKTQPFIVVSNGQKVEVLGTHFNISAYGDELSVKTTLLEGSVKVLPSALPKSLPGSEELVEGQRRNDDKGGRILKPGQQSTITSSNQIAVAEVDVSQVIAWKAGEFVFTNESLESIMRKVARWYDVEVIYDSNAPRGVTLGGYVSRSRNISVILERMERTGKVIFKIDGKKVYVLPK